MTAVSSLSEEPGSDSVASVDDSDELPLESSDSGSVLLDEKASVLSCADMIAEVWAEAG